MNKFMLLLVLVLPFCAFGSTSNEQKEPNKQLDNVLAQQQFKAIGETTFSILFWDLYKSKLMTTSGDYPVNFGSDALVYEINYLADISKEDLIKRTVEQWQHIGVKAESYQPFLGALNDLWPNINKGDKLSMLVNGQSSAFYFNNEHLGDINSPEFGPMFLDIWLAENTSQPKLRRELLGKAK